jgi:hypothetical protein
MGYDIKNGFGIVYDVLGSLQDVTEELKTTMGPNADPWRTESRIQ